MTLLNPKIPTSYTGIFYKEIINDDKKVVDKVFLIRYKDEIGRDKQKTIGKYSQGIRIPYCKAIRDETIVKIKLGENLPKATAKKPKYTLHDLAIKWLDLKKANKTYEGELQRYTATLKELIGSKIAEHLKKQDIINLQAKLMKMGYAPSTIQHFLTMVSGIYQFAIDENLIKISNPCENVKTIRFNNERERYLTTNEIETLKDALSNKLELLLFVEIALSTGARLGSIMEMKKSDIDFKNESIKINNFKTNDKYIGYLNDSTLKILKLHCKTLKKEHKIFSVSRSYVSYKVRGVMRELFNEDITDDYQKVVIHTLRHTFASHLAINGCPIYTIKELMNHKTIEMTERYAKLAPNQGKIQVQNLYQKQKN
jgi:integrase